MGLDVYLYKADDDALARQKAYDEASNDEEARKQFEETIQYVPDHDETEQFLLHWSG